MLLLYIFIWPFALAAICAWTLWRAPRWAFTPTLWALAGVIAVSAAPLAFETFVERSGSDLAAGSLMAYGLSALILLLGAGLKALGGRVANAREMG